MAVDDAGQHVFVSQPQGNDIEELDFEGNVVATISNVYGAYGMTIVNGVLYVAESTTGDIVGIPLGVTPLAPTVLATGLNDPIWLVYTGGKLWAAEAGDSASVVSVDPTTGATSVLASNLYAPDLAVSPGDPNTLFVALDGLSAGSIYRYDVSTSPATKVASNPFTDQDNIEGLAVSPDGTRVIPASGAPYVFEELSASTLQADGLRYPGQAYPKAVAVSASGLVATGLTSQYGAPNVAVYVLGVPQAVFQASIGDRDVASHGLALSADGTRLFAVTPSVFGSGPSTDSLITYELNAPTVTITAPADGQTYAIGQVVSASYACAVAIGAIASCTDSNAGSGGTGQLYTGTLGGLTYTVTAAGQDGSVGTASIHYTVAAPPSALITTPADGATYTQGQVVNASYACQEGLYGPGISAGGCTGTVNDGTAIDTSSTGSHSFAVTALSADGQIASRRVSYTVTAPAPPTVSITAPADGATYLQGQVVTASYSCRDGDGPGLLPSGGCTGTVTDGTAIDASTTGSHSFSVTATSIDGLSTTKTVNYSVVAPGPPSVSIATPADGATYVRGQVVNASFSCHDDPSGPGLPSLGGCLGTVANGAPIDTWTLGAHSFTVMATSSDGQSTPKTVTYAVQAASADIATELGGATAATDSTTFTETLSVGNLGPDDATDVVSVMAIPPGVTVWNSGGGTIVNGMIEWDQSSLPADGTASHEVTFKADSSTSGTVTIWAVASPLGIQDPVYDNNFASQQVALTAPGQRSVKTRVKTRANPFKKGPALIAQLERVKVEASVQRSTSKAKTHKAKHKRKVKRGHAHRR